jgi:TetR/AcrR family transcriptional regulator, tetracycline repressor protein
MAAPDNTAPLSAERIVAAALEIASEQGVEAVSMRRVGSRLGAAPMSLYRHVPSKDALLELMADHVLARLPYPDPSGDWRSEIHAFFLAFHDLLLEYPAVAHVMVEMALAGPELAMRGELVLSSLLAGGLDEPAAAQAITALTWQTVGGSLYAIARRNPEHEDRGWRLQSLPADRFPAVHRVAPYLAADAGREHFEATLWHLIHGFEPG